MCVSAVEFGSFKYFDFFLLSRPPPCSPLFPYTTLFRSLCGRFTARVVRDVKIEPSPKWLKDRLEASGVASISNVVDISKDRKSTRLNSSHMSISYAVFCLKKKKHHDQGQLMIGYLRQRP